jgi:hypothetical protein
MLYPEKSGNPALHAEAFGEKNGAASLLNTSLPTNKQ